MYVYPELVEVLVSAQKALQDGDFGVARKSLNRARALNAKIWRRQARLDRFSNIEWAEQQGLTPETSAGFLELTLNIRQQWASVARWFDTLITTVGREELLASSDGIDILLDRYLPFHWDVNQDIVVLSGPNATQFVSALVARNQLHMIVVQDFDIDDSESVSSLALPPADSRSVGKRAVVVTVARGESLSTKQCDAFRSLEPPGLVSIPTDAKGLELPEFENIKHQMDARFIQRRSTSFWPTIFTNAIIKNIPHIYGLRSAVTLKERITKKNILIVSPGPSLLNSISQISAFREHFVIVSLVRSLPVLFDHDIVPDFAILVDAQDHTSERLKLIPDNPLISEVPLILSEFAHRSSYEAGFKEIFVLPSSGLIGSPTQVVMHGADPPVVNGGSVAIHATALCAEMEARSITLVGQDLSVSDTGLAYASKSQEALKPAEYVTCLGINGEQLRTQTDYKNFAREFENIGKKYAKHDVMLINSTAHGAFLQNWEHLPLDDNHPAISEKDPARAGTVDSMLNQGELDVAPTKKHDIQVAILGELNQLEKISVLLGPLITELNSLLADKSEDTSYLSALEYELSVALGTKGSYTKFYTSPAKLELEASLESNENLRDNLIVSLDYYLAIQAGVRRLTTLFTDAQTAIDQQ